MADLGAGLVGFPQQSLYRTNRLGGAEPDRLVEDDPAVKHGVPG
jgi:hypothetical protein